MGRDCRSRTCGRDWKTTFSTSVAFKEEGAGDVGFQRLRGYRPYVQSYVSGCTPCRFERLGASFLALVSGQSTGRSAGKTYFKSVCHRNPCGGGRAFRFWYVHIHHSFHWQTSGEISAGADALN